MSLAPTPIPQTRSNALTSPGAGSSRNTVNQRDKAAGKKLRRYWLLGAFFGIPYLALAIAYGWLAIAHGELLLWDVIVHESGRYTLGQTVFYFEHFLREIPTDLAMALFLVAAFVRASNAPLKQKPRNSVFMLAGFTVVLATILVLFAWKASVAADGSASALRDLLQFRTRDDIEAYGSHWHFHWLSTLWFGCACWVLTTGMGRLFGWKRPIAQSRGRALTWLAWGYFALLTAAFGFSRAILSDPRYIGHQAREIMTHGPITMLLTLGLFLLLGFQRSDLATPIKSPRQPFGLGLWVCIALTVLIPAFLTARTVTGPVIASGQVDSGLDAMVAAHFFEHVLDYGLVVLIAVAGLAFTNLRGNQRGRTSGLGPATAVIER